ncbi:hypothetical protein SESBI_40231 [Sesbania bispinosa]|nr:hypothetical protein SESBI_40231 [Sesbania bispinosa]
MKLVNKVKEEKGKHWIGTEREQLSVSEKGNEIRIDYKEEAIHKNPKPSKPPSILFLTPPRPKTHCDVACAKERRRSPPSTAKGTSPSHEEDPLLAIVLTVDVVAGGENTTVVLAEGTSSSPLPSPALFVVVVAVKS